MVLSDSVWKHIPSSGASTSARREARPLVVHATAASPFAPDVTVARGRGFALILRASVEVGRRSFVRVPVSSRREVRGASAGVLGRRKPIMVAGGARLARFTRLLSTRTVGHLTARSKHWPASA